MKLSDEELAHIATLAKNIIAMVTPLGDEAAVQAERGDGAVVAHVFDGSTALLTCAGADLLPGDPLFAGPQPGLTVPEPMTEKPFTDDFERGCVAGWNDCRDTMLAAMPVERG